MSTRCEVHRLGLVDYQQAWDLQETMAAEIARGTRPPTLLLLQHPHTYTIGRSGKPENLLWDERQLEQEGVRVYQVDRGGDITYHGPGQLVGYPLLPLGPIQARSAEDQPTGPSASGAVGLNLALNFVQNLALHNQPLNPAPIPRVDYMGYLRRLETVIILALMRLGVAAAQIDCLTGVWLQAHVPSRCTRCAPELRQAPAKIAAIGVKVDARGVSRHGFALNIQPDMHYWDGIIACGLQDHTVACLADLLDPAPEMETVTELVSEAFGEVFGYEMVEVENSVFH